MNRFFLILCLCVSTAAMPASAQKRGAELQSLSGSTHPDSIGTHTIEQETKGTALTAGEQMVHLSKINVDPECLADYNAMLKEGIEASMRLDPGVLALYAVAEKEAPHRITILEIYADRAAYESHLQTPHFREYKQGTLEMVKGLELVDCLPLIPEMKIK